MKRKFQPPRKLESAKKPKVLIEFIKSSTVLQPSSLTNSYTPTQAPDSSNTEPQSSSNTIKQSPTKYYSVLYKQGPSKSKKPWQDGVLIVSHTTLTLRSENYNYKKEFAVMSKKAFYRANSGKENTKDDNDEKDLFLSMIEDEEKDEFQLYQNEACSGKPYTIQINEQITELKWMKKMKDEEIVAQAAKEISANNIGRKLLLKMGWTPGKSLHSSSSSFSLNITDPIAVVIKHDRAGLGCK